MKEFELINKMKDKKQKVKLHILFIQELGGLLHQQNNVIGNAAVGASAGNEIKASIEAVKTKKRIFQHQAEILKLV